MTMHTLSSSLVIGIGLLFQASSFCQPMQTIAPAEKVGVRLPFRGSLGGWYFPEAVNTTSVKLFADGVRLSSDDYVVYGQLVKATTTGRGISTTAKVIADYRPAGPGQPVSPLYAWRSYLIPWSVEAAAYVVPDDRFVDLKVFFNGSRLSVDQYNVVDRNITLRFGASVNVPLTVDYQIPTIPACTN